MSRLLTTKAPVTRPLNRPRPPEDGAAEGVVGHVEGAEAGDEVASTVEICLFVGTSH